MGGFEERTWPGLPCRISGARTRVDGCSIGQRLSMFKVNNSKNSCTRRYAIRIPAGSSILANRLKHPATMLPGNGDNSSDAASTVSSVACWKNSKPNVSFEGYGFQRHLKKQVFTTRLGLFR